MTVILQFNENHLFEVCFEFGKLPFIFHIYTICLMLFYFSLSFLFVCFCFLRGGVLVKISLIIRMLFSCFQFFLNVCSPHIIITFGFSVHLRQGCNSFIQYIQNFSCHCFNMAFTNRIFNLDFSSLQYLLFFLFCVCVFSICFLNLLFYHVFLFVGCFTNRRHIFCSVHSL